MDRIAQIDAEIKVARQKFDASQDVEEIKALGLLLRNLAEERAAAVAGLRVDFSSKSVRNGRLGWLCVQ